MANFQISHSGIATDIIYHIICGRYEYIGQSKTGFNRIQKHLTGSFRNKSVEAEDIGIDKIYAEMRRRGLRNTTVIYYTAENNYGLTAEDLDNWLTLFIPAGENNKTWDPSKATTDQRRDAAEILHILSAGYAGQYELVNQSFGGQTTSWRLRIEGDTYKLLTRQTDIKTAMQLINASDTSIVNMFNVFTQVNEYMFTDKWNTIYDPKYAAEVEGDQKLLKMTWREFVTARLGEFTIKAMRARNGRVVYEPNQGLHDEIHQFVELKFAYLKAVTPIIGDKKVKPTEAHKRLLELNAQHLFSASISVDNLTKYIIDAVNRGLDNIKFLGNKKWEGNINQDRAAKLRVVSVSGMFDVSKMHTTGSVVSEWIQNCRPNDGTVVDETLMKGFSYSNFQYVYDRTPKIQFMPNTSYEYATEDTEIIKHSPDGGPNSYPITSMSSRYVSQDQRLVNRMHEQLATEYEWGFVNAGWRQYFRDMMSIYRRYHEEMQLYEYEDNHGNDLYGTKADLSEEGLWLYFSDVYHQDIQTSLETLSIY